MTAELVPAVPALAKSVQWVTSARGGPMPRRHLLATVLDSGLTIYRCGATTVASKPAALTLTVCPRCVRREGVAAVYVLRDAAGQALYVGSSYDPFTRMGWHELYRHWWPQVASCDLTWFDDRGDAYAAEARLIRDLSPLHNRGPVFAVFEYKHRHDPELVHPSCAVSRAPVWRVGPRDAALGPQTERP